MVKYYSTKLAGERLKACYDLAPPAVKKYLSEEIAHIRSRIRREDAVLELGCGYGRVLKELASGARLVMGIDTSLPSLKMAIVYLSDIPNAMVLEMEAVCPGFREESFDLVCCPQNGISAFHADQRRLIQSALSLTRPGGLVMFSSYAEEFWEYRLDWFRLQAAHGLIGALDEEATANGRIVCRDGFTATTVGKREFQELTRGLGGCISIEVVAGSSIFCEICK